MMLVMESTTPGYSRRSLVLIVSILLWTTAAATEGRRRTTVRWFGATSPTTRTRTTAALVAARHDRTAIIIAAVDHPLQLHLHRKRDNPVFRPTRRLLFSTATNQASKSASSLLKLRGGGSLAEEDDDEEEEEEEIEEDEDEDFFDALDEEGFLSVDDHDDASAFTGEDDMGKRLAKAWAKTPPVTKAAVCGMAMYQNEFPTFMSWDTKRMLTRMELWRPFTSFLNFGPLGISYLLSMQFVWSYMSTLERMNHNKPYDFWIMILFGMASMIIGYPVLKLSPRLLGHNLSTYMVYIWSRNHEGVEVSFFDILTFKAELLPWVFLAQTYLLEGEPPVLDLLGIVFGHVYYHLKRTGMLQAPRSLVRWYEKSAGAAALRELYKPIAADFDPV
jgi:Derlin-2/3